MNRNAVASLALAVAAVLAVAGCTPSKDDKPPAPKVSSAPAGPLPKLGEAPKWEMKDLSGKPIRSDELTGKVIVVDFWATWCAPCRAEIPDYIAMQKKYGADGLVIVGASVDQGGPEVVQEFVAKNAVNYTMLMAEENVVSAFGGLNAVPTAFLIDRSGQVRYRKEGLEEDFEQKIASVLREKT